MTFRTLPPGLAARLIEGCDDKLTPAAEAQRVFFETTPCGRCGSAMEPTIYGRRAFTADTPLPRTVARCVDCGYTVDPHTNLVLDTGDASKIDEALPIIRAKEEG